MKLIAQILVVVAMSYCLEAFKLPAVGSGKLAKDFQDLVDLIPMEKASELIKAYVNKDREFQLCMHVLSSKEMGLFVKNVEAAPELADLFYFMQEFGLDIYYLVMKLNRFIDSPDINEPTDSNMQIIGGLAGFAEDFSSLVPLEKMLDMVQEKVAAGGVFAEYYRMCTEKSFFNFYVRTQKDIHFRALVRWAELLSLDSKLFEQLFPVLFIIRITLAI